jgi:hypothetical protein
MFAGWAHLFGHFWSTQRDLAQNFESGLDPVIFAFITFHHRVELCEAYHAVPVMVNLWNNARMKLLGVELSNSSTDGDEVIRCYKFAKRFWQQRLHLVCSFLQACMRVPGSGYIRTVQKRISEFFGFGIDVARAVRWRHTFQATHKLLGPFANVAAYKNY